MSSKTFLNIVPVEDYHDITDHNSFFEKANLPYRVRDVGFCSGVYLAWVTDILNDIEAAPIADAIEKYADVFDEGTASDLAHLQLEYSSSENECIRLIQSSWNKLLKERF